MTGATFRGCPVRADGSALVDGVHYDRTWVETELAPSPADNDRATEPQILAAAPLHVVHFSDLKRMAQSPAHYRHHIDTPFAPTRAMRIGTLVDRLLLGGELPPIWKGTRSGAKWGAFAAAQMDPGEICTEAELADAEPIAASVRTDPRAEVARHYLTGRHQVALEWEMLGLPCSTRGVDVVGDGWISDLKVTQTTEPDRWQWQARRMHYDAQLAFYAEGCRQNGIEVDDGAFLVGVESSAPYATTVLRLSPKAIEIGERKIHLWLERLCACLDADEWPGYAQSVVTFDAPDEEVKLLGLDDAEELQ